MEGNNKAIREALETVYRIAYTAKNDFDVFAGIERIRRISEAALGKPPRNCDVGTASEQDDRMTLYCQTSKCESCPLWDNINNGVRCEFAWSQMPYEEGGEK